MSYVATGLGVVMEVGSTPVCPASYPAPVRSAGGRWGCYVQRKDVFVKGAAHAPAICKCPDKSTTFAPVQTEGTPFQNVLWKCPTCEGAAARPPPPPPEATATAVEPDPTAPLACLPDDQWEALPRCPAYFQNMPAACKSPQGPTTPAEQSACRQHATAAPANICHEYALAKVTGAPQSVFDKLFGMPSCSGKTRAPSEAAAAPGKINTRTLLIGAAVVVGGVLVWKAVSKG